jgi:uncharacterized membrane protein
MARAVCAFGLLAWLFCSAGSAIAAPDPAPASRTADASVMRSAERATTFKVLTSITNLAILTTATGSLIAGTALTGVTVVTSWSAYVLNDYLWDTYDPAPSAADGTQSFNAEQTLWRTTKKYLTFKPLATSAKFAALYLWTGSMGATLVYGTASAFANTVSFYVNNLGWDYYDATWRAPAP